MRRSSDFGASRRLRQALSWRPSIAQRLVLTFVGLTLLVLVVTLGLARWSFERGFLDYMNALEQERLERLAALLVRHYQSAGDRWSRLGPQDFGRMLERVAPSSRPLGGEAASAAPRRAMSGAPLHAPPRRHPPGPPTALYDTDGQRLYGPDLDSSGSAPIRVAIRLDGQTIGELRSVPHRRFDSPQATAFFRQQRQASLVIGVFALALAVGISVLLSRALLRPLRRAISGVDALAGGDYGSRLGEARADELGRLMSGLDHLAETLEQSRSTQQRWLADISHELRTPVTILAGEIDALKDGIRRFDAQQLDSLDQEVGRLRRLIEDLYTLSVADMGGLRYSFSPTELSAILIQVGERSRLRAAEAGLCLEIACTPDVWVKADAIRLEQLLRNLIENALAYTDAPGRIEVRLSCDAGQACLEFDDTPPGVPESDFEQLFEPLYRQEAARRRRASGAGLGLAICRHIVAAHRGRLWAERSRLGGLCIQVRLPLYEG